MELLADVCGSGGRERPCRGERGRFICKRVAHANVDELRLADLVPRPSCSALPQKRQQMKLRRFSSHMLDTVAKTSTIELRDAIMDAVLESGWTKVEQRQVRKVVPRRRARGGGRPVGAFKVKDLEERLEGHVLESGWSLKHNGPRRFLMGTRTSIARTIGMPRRTLARRVQGLLSKAKQRSGLCPYCSQWDRCDRGKVVSLLDHLRGTLHSLITGVFANLDRRIEDDAIFSQPQYDVYACKRFWDMTMQYVDDLLPMLPAEGHEFWLRWKATHWDNICMVVDGMQTHCVYAAGDFAEPCSVINSFERDLNHSTSYAGEKPSVRWWNGSNLEI